MPNDMPTWRTSPGSSRTPKHAATPHATIAKPVQMVFDLYQGLVFSVSSICAPSVTRIILEAHHSIHFYAAGNLRTLVTGKLRFPIFCGKDRASADDPPPPAAV